MLKNLFSSTLNIQLCARLRVRIMVFVIVFVIFCITIKIMFLRYFYIKVGSKNSVFSFPIQCI